MPRSLADFVTVQAERRPDAVAVAGEDRHLTYASLESRSGRLGRLLEEADCGPGDRVGLLAPKSPEAIAALVGIYRAGAIAVPLDPSSPPARLAKIVDACRPRWILAGGPVAPALAGIRDAAAAGRDSLRVGWFEGPAPDPDEFAVRFDARDLETVPDRPPFRRRAPIEAAHILFTSGSTGTPKGVVVTHAAVIHFVEWGTRHFGIGPDDRTSGHTPLHFDLSFFDLFGSFAAGARLCLVPPRAALLPTTLAEFMRETRLTQWFSVPSVLQYMAKFDVVRPGDFPALRRILWCGEVFPTPSLIYWMKRVPHARFTNLYGPTETTIASSHYTVPSCPAGDRREIPIGTSCEGEELLILDDRLQPVPDGETGHLYIGGAGLSPGYWNDPFRTAAAFLPDPRAAHPGGRIYRTGDLARRGGDGLVCFVGRADTQIKSRGYRIELGEIEAGLDTLPVLRESAVVAIPTGGFESAILCCAYVPAGGGGVTPADLRRDLGRLVPSPMLPSRWMAFERLPRNGNGKIDRAFLKETFERHETAADRHA